MHAQINGLVSGDVVRDAKEKPKKSILAPLLPEAIPEATQKFHVDGRFISITPAVSKQIATKLTQASNLNKRAQDKRHLYLMREGVVFPGTEAAEQLTPEEVEARMATFAARKRLLATNPNLFVSRTRLSVRGLHPKLTDAQLKAAARIAVNGFWEDVANGLRKPMEEEVVQEEQEMGLGVPGPKRKIFITQAKIIKDMDRLDPVTKKPKSKGYGFIEFKSHADSLACLRYMNNNVEAFAKAMGQEYNNGKKKNPSVEFAVENNLVLKKRKEREIRGEKRKGEDKNGDDKKRKVDSGDRDRGKKGEKKVQDLKSRGPAKSTDRDSKDLKSTRPPFKSNDRDTRSPRAPFKSNDRDAKDSRAPRHPFKSNDRKPERKYSDTFLKNRKDTGKVSKKSTSTTPEKLPKRQFKREQKAKEESKFESLVTNFKKKLIDNATMTKSATSKWYA
jgi:nucleolar protein 4